MKRRVSGMLVLLAAMLVQADEYRTFTDKQGRTLDARIVSFDTGKGEIELEREDGKRFKVSPLLFSDSDQTYIGDWIAADKMLSESNLRISFKKRSEPVDTKATPEQTGFDGEAVHYEVTLENRSRQPIENLEIDYRYFITVAFNGVDRSDMTRPVSGRTSISRIDAMSSEAFDTDAATFGEKIKQVAVHDSNGRFQGYDEQTVSDEDLEGIWLKIKGPVLDGERVVRDVFYPDGLEKKAVWGEALSPRIEQALMRGVPATISEFHSWMEESFDEILETADEGELRELSEYVGTFYDPAMDTGGIRALQYAVAYYHKELYDLTAFWLDKAEAVSNTLVFKSLLLGELYGSVPSMCDGEKAVAYAKQAVASDTREPGAWHLNVMAMAYARNNRFQEAVQSQEQAVAKLQGRLKERYRESFEQRLELYRAGKPYDLNVTDPLCWCYNIRIISPAPDRQAKTQSGSSGAHSTEYVWPEENPEDNQYIWRMVSTRQGQRPESP